MLNIISHKEHIISLLYQCFIHVVLLAHCVPFIFCSDNIATSVYGVTFSAVTIFLKQQPEVIMNYKLIRTNLDKNLTLSGDHLVFAKKIFH